MGYLNKSLLQIYSRVCQWKNVENRLTFGKFMGKSLMSFFGSRYRSCMAIVIVVHESSQCNLDSGQNPTSARLAVPLAACVQKIYSVNKTDKNWLPWQRPLRDRKPNFILAIFYQPWKFGEDRSGGLWDSLIGLTEIVKTTTTTTTTTV